MTVIDLRAHIKNFPETSGVYLMKDHAGTIIYVGKAVNLRRRVQSYFRAPQGKMTKTDLLVQAIGSIDYVLTASEAEALILEASLIKRHQPKYNIELRDDKSYPYIIITDEAFARIAVERLMAFDPATLKKLRVKKYYGPYVNPRLIREALTIIRKVFPFRTCTPLPAKACLDYHIGLCTAPCIEQIDRVAYRKLINNVCWIFEGRKDRVYRNLKKEMEALTQQQAYEAAAKVRDQLRALGALYSGTSDINYYKEAEQLQRALGLERLPERIETFDISNTMGQQAVGSMVSFAYGKPDKRQYRRFRIKTVDGIDDFRMMAEVVRRRYTRLKKEQRLLPDLIVVDGGKGQLSAAVAELKILKIDVPIVSLAKREEEIFQPHKKNPVRLNKMSLGLQLLQRMRDEAHRFAITYHRSLRQKKFLGRR